MPGVLLWGWDEDAGEWKKVLVDTDGKLRISDADPFEIVQDTPTDLKHVPHGRVAGDGVYVPFALSAAHKLQVEMDFLAHASRHEDVGSDEISIAGLAGESVELAAHIADFLLHTKTVKKTVNQVVNNSTTLVNDNHLLFAVGAEESWLVQYFILYHGSATADIKWAISVPTGKAARWHCATGWHNAGTGSNPSSIQTEGSVVSAGAKTSHAGVFINAIIYASGAAGNVVLQWAQNVAEASDTTVREHSCLIAHRLA